MAEFHAERREPVRVAGTSVEVTLQTIGETVGAVFDDVEARLRDAQIDVNGAGLLRYTTVSRRDPFTVEVAFEVPADAAIPDGLDAHTLPGGMFAMARQYGAYAWIGGLTKELMDWGDQQGLDYAMVPGPNGDVWECWFEAYPDPPISGPEGLEGHVEIGLKLAD